MKNFNNLEIVLDGINYTFYFGKNAKGNFQIIDIAADYDIWFHMKEKESSHVILRIPINFKEEHFHLLAKKAAEICKSKSKYKNDKKIDIIFTEISNIEKTKEIGKVKIKNIFNTSFISI